MEGQKNADLRKRNSLAEATQKGSKFKIKKI